MISSERSTNISISKKYFYVVLFSTFIHGIFYVKDIIY